MYLPLSSSVFSGNDHDSSKCRSETDTDAVKVRDAIRLIEQDEWAQVRPKGSHRQFHHPKKPGTVTVAGHPSDEVPPGTLKNIMKQAGIEK